MVTLRYKRDYRLQAADFHGGTAHTELPTGRAPPEASYRPTHSRAASTTQARPLPAFRIRRPREDA